MALSLAEGNPGRTPRSFRRISSGPKTNGFLPRGGEANSSISKNVHQLKLAINVGSKIDWALEARLSERDPDGVDFPTLNPDGD
jgi:hypothetical protein